MTQTVLILGASGKIGKHAAKAFAHAGWTVKMYDRERGDMTAAAQGVQVIVNGLNPPNYHNWAGIIPQITRDVIAAAKASGATVIIPGNIYNFGGVNGVIDETTPQRPCSKKGQIRVEMEAAYRASGVQTIVLRAGNFMDPERNKDVFSMLVANKARKGLITAMGDPQATQAYAYLPDWAQVAFKLAERRDSLSTFEDVPFGGYAFSAEELGGFVTCEIGREVKVKQFAWWMMSATAPFWELAREFKEMRYLMEMSHSMSDTKLKALVPDFTPTDQATAIRACLPS